MKKLSCIIVDDEPVARKILQEFAAQIPFLDVLGNFESAMKAEEFLKVNQPDLIFLDIQMPEKSGFDLLEMLDNVPEVVFVTAFDQHALRAFDACALDYLLKPVSPERLRRGTKRCPGLNL